MILHVLMGQRKEAYPGQYGPEALAVMDEYGMSDNPDFMTDELNKFKSYDEFVSLVVFDIRVDGNEVSRQLNPQNPQLKGEIIK